MLNVELLLRLQVRRRDLAARHRNTRQMFLHNRMWTDGVVKWQARISWAIRLEDQARRFKVLLGLEGQAFHSKINREQHLLQPVRVADLLNQVSRRRGSLRRQLAQLAHHSQVKLNLMAPRHAPEHPHFHTHSNDGRRFHRIGKV